MRGVDVGSAEEESVCRMQHAHDLHLAPLPRQVAYILAVNPNILITTGGTCTAQQNCLPEVCGWNCFCEQGLKGMQ